MQRTRSVSDYIKIFPQNFMLEFINFIQNAPSNFKQRQTKQQTTAPKLTILNLLLLKPPSQKLNVVHVRTTSIATVDGVGREKTASYFAPCVCPPNPWCSAVWSRAWSRAMAPVLLAYGSGEGMSWSQRASSRGLRCHWRSAQCQATTHDRYWVTLNY